MNKLKRVLLAIVLAFSIGMVASQNDVKAEVTPFPNGISSFGMTILPGIGGQSYTGNIWFVDSGHPDGSDSLSHEPGNRLEPFKTLDFAIGQTTANNGDVIIVLPGHSENWDAADGTNCDVDVAGITIVNLGQGGSRPTYNFRNAGSDMDIDAANVTWIGGLLQTSSTDTLSVAVTNPVDVNSADFRMFDVEVRDVGVATATTWIDAGSSTARLVIDGYLHSGTSSASAEHSIQIAGINPIIRNFKIYGNFSIAPIMATGTNCREIDIGGGQGWNQIWNANSTDTGINCAAGITGNIGPNINVRLQDNAGNFASAYSGEQIHFYDPLRVVNAVNERSTDSLTIVYSTGGG